MKGWHLKRIDDLGAVVTGKTPSSDYPDEFGVEYPFVTPSDIPNTQKYITVERYISEKGMESHKRIKLPTKTTCVVCIGATIGKTCMTHSLSFSNQQINSIIANHKNDSDFIYYMATTLKDSLVAFAGGAATPIVNKSTFSSIKVLVPEKKIQSKIAAVLSAYDELIENNNRRIAILEKMAEELYREWFVRLRFPGHEKVKIVKGVPEGWEVKKLPGIAEITYGFPFDGSRFNSDGIGKPIIRIRNIPDASTTDFTDEHANEKYIIRKGDLLVGMDGVFHINHWYSDDAYLVQRSCRIKAKNPIQEGYLAKAIYAPVKFYESILQGATVGHLGAKHLNSIEILVPAKEIDISIFNRFLEQKVKIASSNNLLRHLRNRLLSRLMSGKIDVENLVIRFPASMKEKVTAHA